MGLKVQQKELSSLEQRKSKVETVLKTAFFSLIVAITTVVLSKGAMDWLDMLKLSEGAYAIVHSLLNLVFVVAYALGALVFLWWLYLEYANKKLGIKLKQQERSFIARSYVTMEDPKEDE